MPPFHSRSTGARRIAEIRSSGRSAASFVEVEDLAHLRGDRDRLERRECTPPPAEISALS
jgi:hypothetical protein